MLILAAQTQGNEQRFRVAAQILIYLLHSQFEIEVGDGYVLRKATTERKIPSTL